MTDFFSLSLQQSLESELTSHNSLFHSHLACLFTLEWTCPAKRERIGGWPLDYEEQRCWANCPCN